jgi:hypothetical protein
MTNNKGFWDVFIFAGCLLHRADDAKRDNAAAKWAPDYKTTLKLMARSHGAPGKVEK